MPFCTNCGNRVGDSDVFCSVCGTKQSAGATPGAGANASDFVAGMNPRTIAALCYVPVLGWISSLYVLAGDRFRKDQTVRFHAFQGLYLFVGWLVLDWGFGGFAGGFRRLVGLAKAVISIVSIVMLVKTLQNKDERLPLVGDLADRSVKEQL